MIPLLNEGARYFKKRRGKLEWLKMKFVQADLVSHKEDNPSNRIFLKLYFQMKIESGQVGVAMPPGATRIRGHSLLQQKHVFNINYTEFVNFDSLFPSKESYIMHLVYLKRSEF
jgi:hypothetical protein